ncbi:hypothetical protein L228DRAFT_249800 [Xylona heveae TC161]|uniref:N-acetyltransferase domain-containing protein n=1 Tax=Xylona heveae (strain CBS 132557 / TC161) TaxID=1328760 RepID=A0A165FGU8_XYLHT|nr:hypothetical protein L228DRAFT_249800 [Xylona heveae TC161]KZF20962.1 hypothetical protein L228DRAFT_249800 [Xylona heveae TC161]
MSLPTETRNWVRDGFLISTDKTLLSIPAINAVFDQEYVYWTTAVPDEILQQIVDGSFCLGVYKTTTQSTHSTDPAVSETHSTTTNAGASVSTHLEQIGFARLVTDNTTIAFLTDLYVLPEYQGFGLGGWLIDCVDELLSPLPYLRWALLRTSSQKSKESYEKRLGMRVLDTVDVSQGTVVMGKKGRGAMG